MKKKYFYCMMMCLAGLLVGCSDDDVKLPDNVIPVLKGSTGEELTITHLGFGCDITQEIGNSREHILNLNALKKDGALVLDENAENMYIEATGEDYASMTNSLNKYLVGDVPSVSQMAFSWNLDAISERKAHQLDIYEYGMAVAIKKLYGMNIKQDFVSRLKDYVRESVWAEINATDKDNRTDKTEIKQLYKTYGTHVATQIFAGGMHQGILFREQLEWESGLNVQLSIFSDSIMSYKENGFEWGTYDREISVTSTDTECYKNSDKLTIQNRMGGDGSIIDNNQWFGSITLQNSVFLGYGLGTTSIQDSGLIPLYELLSEGDERRTAMKEALDEYVEENTIPLEYRKMVILDAFGKHFSDGNAPQYLYEERNGKNLKYFRIDEEISKHVCGITEGKFHFYYALGHLIDEAVVDMKFDESSDIDGNWETRGDHANVGVTGVVKNRYLCIKTKNVNNGIPESEFVTGFGVKVDGKVKSISKGTETNFEWKENGDDWYKGLVHDEVYCIYTKDNLKGF